MDIFRKLLPMQKEAAQGAANHQIRIPPGKCVASNFAFANTLGTGRAFSRQQLISGLDWLLFYFVFFLVCVFMALVYIHSLKEDPGVVAWEFALGSAACVS